MPQRRVHAALQEAGGGARQTEHLLALAMPRLSVRRHCTKACVGLAGARRGARCEALLFDEAVARLSRSKVDKEMCDSITVAEALTKVSQSDVGMSQPCLFTTGPALIVTRVIRSTAPANHNFRLCVFVSSRAAQDASVHRRHQRAPPDDCWVLARPAMCHA